MNKFTKIRQFHDIVTMARKYPEHFSGTILFRGTVKLHGTNAGVRVGPDGDVQPQSRNRELFLGDDNFGFAEFAYSSERVAMFRDMAAAVLAAEGTSAEPVTFYGEWCGPGVQGGVAIADLETRQFVLFAIRIGDVVEDEPGRYSPMFPILSHLGHGVHCVESPGAFSAHLEVDLLSPADCGSAADYLTELTEAVDKLCPWAKMFGHEGTGEGIVWKPRQCDRHWGNTDLFFKTKGEKHKNKGAKKVRIDQSPETLATIDKFVGFAATPARLAQGVEVMREMGIDISMKSTGDYLKWVANDVSTECAADLLASGLTWKSVAKGINHQALMFWKSEVSS